MKKFFSTFLFKHILSKPLTWIGLVLICMSIFLLIININITLTKGLTFLTLILTAVIAIHAWTTFFNLKSFIASYDVYSRGRKINHYLWYEYTTTVLPYSKRTKLFEQLDDMGIKYLRRKTASDDFL